MKGRRIRRGAAALLLCLLAPLARVRAEEASSRADILNPLHGLAKDTLSGFRDRPLFSPARAEPRAPESAPPIVVVPPAVPPEPPPSIRLVGIVSGAQTLAVVKLMDGGKTRVLATGDTLGAWTATVSEAGLRLQAEARSVEFGLFQAGAVPDPDRAAPAQAPPAVKGADAFPPTGDPPPP